MLTSTGFPLKATALPLKRGGRSLGIGVLLTDPCVAMLIFENDLVMIVVTCGGFLCFA